MAYKPWRPVWPHSLRPLCSVSTMCTYSSSWWGTHLRSLDMFVSYPSHSCLGTLHPLLDGAFRSVFRMGSRFDCPFLWEWDNLWVGSCTWTLVSCLVWGRIVALLESLWLAPRLQALWALRWRHSRVESSTWLTVTGWLWLSWLTQAGLQCLVNRKVRWSGISWSHKLWVQ